MPLRFEKIIRYTVSLLFVGLTVYLGYIAERAEFVPFITAYGVFFGLYIWLVFARKNMSIKETRWYVALGIALRVLLLFSIPNLSDDFYRFLWDGRLTAAGFHPFTHPPIYFIENQVFPKGITPELFGKLNSQIYFTVYPPVCQAVFAAASWLSPVSISGGVLVLKLFLLACEAGTIFQLAVGRSSWPLQTNNQQSTIYNSRLIYALNPLVILEITGNCHFEGAMIFFLLAGLRAMERQKIRQSALWWALATATKLLPLMFLPVVWRQLGWRKGLVFSVIFGGACLILFAPLFGVLPNIFSSLDLYFRQFQFNASVYYLLRAIGFWIKGYDIGESLGPLLGMMTVAGVLVLAWRNPTYGPGGMGVALLFTLMLQLSLSATVHPWYVTVPFAIGLLTQWRFPIVWSGLVALSYSHYAGGAFEENYWLIGLEYIALGLFVLWETKNSNQRS